MSSEIKLIAANPTEQRVLDYLTANASEVLAEKINAGPKTIYGALEYAKGEAKKLDHEDGCVCVDDATVFGWIIHYFEEAHITEKTKAPAVKLPGGVKIKTGPTVMTAKEKKDEIETLKKRLLQLQTVKVKRRPKKVKAEQTSMFEALLGGNP